MEALMPERVLDLRSLVDDLRRDSMLSEGDANLLLGQARSREEALLHPLTFLGRRNFANPAAAGQPLTSEVLVDWLAKKSGQPLYHIDPLKIDVSNVTPVMSFQFAKRHKILCVEQTRDSVTIASAQPWVSAWEAQLEQTLKKEIRRVVADPQEIDRYMVEFYSLANSVSGASGLHGGTKSSVTNFEQLVEIKGVKDHDANDQHIVNIVDWLLQYAFDQRASDIHVEPRRDNGKVRFRIDGVLHQVYELPLQVMHAVTARIKSLGRMNIAEKRKPQDGRVKTLKPDGSEIELRLSTLPTAFGEKLVMRIFDPEVLMRSATELGIVGEDLQRWMTMVEKPYGIVLVTGPTGSGKTTTLYASLKVLATEEVNVSTLEDPIEMVVPEFNQTQIQSNIDLTFAAGVRTLLRQDPDIIMVGEIRDLETADMAVQAALTGHLVISTLHTNDAPSAIARLLDLGVPPYLIQSAMNGIMAQRLVRTLCPHCKEEHPVDKKAWEQLVRPWRGPVPEKTYRPVGCLECRNTGYLGRQGIYEVMPVSEHLKTLIRGDVDLSELRNEAMKEGMKPLRLSGAQKVAAGVTTIEEVMRVAPPPQK